LTTWSIRIGCAPTLYVAAPATAEIRSALPLQGAAAALPVLLAVPVLEPLLGLAVLEPLVGTADGDGLTRLLAVVGAAVLDGVGVGEGVPAALGLLPPPGRSTQIVTTSKTAAAARTKRRRRQ
jgi:hypothetical protein